MLGKLLNGLIEKAVDKWLASEASKRYVSSAILRWGQVGMIGLLGYLAGRKYGLTPDGAAAITSHWSSILEIASPVVAAWAIERASLLRAKLNAKALEIAVEAPQDVLTPADAKAAAKVAVTGKAA